MYYFFTFFHIIGFITWLGLLISLAIILSILKVNIHLPIVQKITLKIMNTFHSTSITSAIVVLLTGSYRISQSNFQNISKPFWLIYMEILGWITVITTIFIMEIFNRKITSVFHINQGSSNITSITSWLSFYIATTVLLMLAIISVVLVVSFKI